MTHLDQKLLVIAALPVSFTMQAAEPEDKFRRGLIEPEQWMTADKVEHVFGTPLSIVRDGNNERVYSERWCYLSPYHWLCLWMRDGRVVRWFHHRSNGLITTWETL
jgi:hypothetical protein